MMPSEERCRDCPYYNIWCPNGLPAGYPACDHPSLYRMQLLDGELDECPDGRL